MMEALWCSARQEWAVVMSARGDSCPEGQVECSSAGCMFGFKQPVPAGEELKVLAAVEVVQERLSKGGGAGC